MYLTNSTPDGVLATLMNSTPDDVLAVVMKLLIRFPSDYHKLYMVCKRWKTFLTKNVYLTEGVCIDASYWPFVRFGQLQSAMNCRESQAKRWKLFRLYSDIRLRDTDICATMSSLKHLTTIQIVGISQLTPSVLESLFKLTQLKSLTLAYCYGQGATFFELTSIWTSKLKRLNMKGNDWLTDEDVKMLAKMQNITSLNLSQCRGVKGTTLDEFKWKGKLKELILDNCDGLQESATRGIGAISSLITLSLSNNPQVDNSWLDGLRPLKGLRELRVANIWKLTDGAFIFISQLQSLRILDLSFCFQIAGNGIHALRPLHHLTQLEMTGCSGLSETGVSTIGQLKSVVILRLVLCSSLKDLWLVPLRNMSSLEHLDLSSCRSLTDTGLSLFDDIPMLRISAKYH